jgi:NTP pyrophosphatase (non-canonical NTP hydrolase)
MNSIDETFFNVGLQRVSNYPDEIGDCLFDLVSYLKQLSISPIDLEKRIFNML